MRNDLPAELIPAAVAVVGGSAALGAISLLERRPQARSSFKLTFPSGVDAASARGLLAAVSGLKHGTELCFELRASSNEISHFISMPSYGTTIVPDKLRGALPALRLDEVDDGPLAGRSTLAIRIFAADLTILQTADAEAASRVLLSGLARLQHGEQVVVRWVVRTSSLAPRTPADLADKALLRTLRRRQSEPGFMVSGLVLVRAANVTRARALGEHVAASIRSRRAGGAGLRLSYERAGRSLASLPKVGRRSGWLSIAEIVPLLGLPLGSVWHEAVTVGASREIAASRDLPRRGRPLLIARDGRGDRPVALTPKAALLHQAVFGPTGTGKSTVIARGILADLAAGYGGVGVDAKNDTVDTVTERVPEQDADRVVVLDPAAPDRVVGLDLLGHEDRWAIEMDMSTESKSTVAAKCRRYIDYYRSGIEQKEHGVFPRTTWAVPTDHRAEQIRSALTGLPAEAQRLFEVCRQDQLVEFLRTEAGS